MSKDRRPQIFIQNLPYEITEDELSQWCETFGRVAKCRLQYDQLGYSRGFAFVTFITPEGHNRILSKGPHFCRKRRLNVRESKDEINPPIDEPPIAAEVPAETAPLDEENFYTEPSNPAMNDDRYEDELFYLREEFEANLEMLKIQHDHELKVLNEQIQKEKKRHDEAKDSLRRAEEDFQAAEKKNGQLRESLVKNTMQTFNLRRDLARQIKEEKQILNDLQHFAANPKSQ